MGEFDFSVIPILETERLRLRRIATHDARDWLTILSHEDVRRYLVDIEQMNFDEISEIIAWTEGIIANRSGIRWAITLKPDDKMIGTCGFHVYDRNNQRLEIGYELGADYWRQGIMREAVRAVLDFAFNTLGVHRVEADVTVGNEGSAGLLKNLGFTHEGTWRDRVFAHGRFYSLWQFALLRDEFS